MNTKIVTAFYSNIEGEPYHGQPYGIRHERFLHSLRVLNNTQHPISCYCSISQKEELEKYIEDFGLLNVTLKVQEISEFEYTSDIQRIKQKTEQFKTYHEIDYGKLHLLRQEYDDSYEYIYWIDVGISHFGLFPIKYNPNYHLATGMSADYNFYSYTNLFKPELISKLNEFVKDKLLSLSISQMFYRSSEFIEKMNFDQILQEHCIGGFIGGKTENIPWMLDQFREISKKCFESDYIPNHEMVMTVIRYNNLERFNNFSFDTWYHRDIVVREKAFNTQAIEGKVCFSDFFDQVLGI